MGLLDKLFSIRTKSEWDGIRYVDAISGNKFWHTCSINEEEMKIYGQRIAFELDPFGPRIREESASTIVGELVFLLRVMEITDDIKGAKFVAKAISNLIENHEEKLPQFSNLKFIGAGYLSYL